MADAPAAGTFVLDGPWKILKTPGVDDEDQLEWCMPLLSADPSASSLNFGNAVEDLNVFPEDMDLEPELIQQDSDDWTITPDPT